MSLFYSSWNCVEVFGWSTDCWVDSWRTSKCFKEYPRRCFCSETCQGKISIYLFIYLFIRLISQENRNVSWWWCAQILLNNWLDQWQSCKLGTGSRVQSFLSVPFSVVNWCFRPVAKSAYCVRQEESTLLICMLRLGVHGTASFGLPLCVFGPSFIHNLITHVCETRTKHSIWSSIIVASTLYKPLVIASLWFYLFIFVRDWKLWLFCYCTHQGS